MANNLYTTKTAALKATKADINKLDAKKMLLNGKNILDYISDSEFNSYDTRDPQLKNDELDIWNTEISLSDNGHIEVKPFEHNYSYLSNTGKLEITRGSSCVHVIDNEILDANNEHVMYWQTDGFTSSEHAHVFGKNINTFNSDLSKMTNGDSMFSYCENLESFTSDLSSLTNGDSMFYLCSALTTFSSDLSSLTDGASMFNNCSNLKSFNSNLSSLTDG